MDRGGLLMLLQVHERRPPRQTAYPHEQTGTLRLTGPKERSAAGGLFTVQ